MQLSESSSPDNCTFANSTHIQTPNHSTQFIVQAKNHCGITLAREARRTKRTPSHAFMSSFDSYFDHYYSSSVRSAENVFWLILRPEAPLGHPAGLSWCHDGGTEVFFSAKSAQINLTSVFILFVHFFDTKKIKADVSSEFITKLECIQVTQKCNKLTFANSHK